MATKYIVNNASEQTINSNVTINGNLTVTGVTAGSLATYKVLLTQTGNLTATTLETFNYGLIIGETYTITDYVSGDDFSNVANVISGVINETGCEFIATGSTPSVWSNLSELSSLGDLIYDVLENNLGYDITWVYEGGIGIYFAFPSVIGPKYNNFPKEKSYSISQLTSEFGIMANKVVTGSGSFSTKDDALFLTVLDFNEGFPPINNTLYYTPFEFNIKQNTDTTPVILNGTIRPSFPFGNASINLACGGNYIESFNGDSTTVNNMSELIIELNTNPETSFLGTYSDNGDGGVLLSMPINLVDRFCSNGTLTFEVSSDIFSYSVRRNNTGTCAASPFTTIYSNSPVLVPGVSVYNDAALTSPIAQYTHICDCVNNIDYTVIEDNTLGEGVPSACTE